MYSRLINSLIQRLERELPSALAHEPLRATPVGPVRPKFKTDEQPRSGSVLILLYEDQGEIKFPLIKRPEYAGAHGGQVSLPGGKTEPGEDSIQTALREANEEIGVYSPDVNVLGRLTEFHVLPSNFLITPVVAAIPYRPVFIPDSYEVAKILSGTVNELIKDDAVMITEVLAAGQYRMQAPHFKIEDEVVWGATAMMLNEFRLILREIMGS
ncbi:CoA pyrophosphatase [Chryseolinea sp. H1M3-3]|uniref:NUDIX hydrolase n=1 Tax=Chryseolinea sp. H1M3-3 TaxID=3034144 RepID=UPI0023EDAF77|nr:CoA pyrophosphatase [Chryseolinea sp. H1M3-3]